jgi:hypothetical protein
MAQKKGYKPTAEHKANLRAAKLGKKLNTTYKKTAEHQAKINAALEGRRSEIAKRSRATRKANGNDIGWNKGKAEIELFGEEKAKLLLNKRNEGRKIQIERKREEIFSSTSLVISRGDLRFIAFRKSCLNRDNYTCQGCGIKQIDIPKTGNRQRDFLHVHHIKDWDSFPELRIEPSNGITYCWECHPDFGTGATNQSKVGRVWITNGVVSRQVKKEIPLSNGWWYGMTRGVA